MFNLLGCSLAVALLASPAMSTSPDALTRSEHVSFADVDLTTAGGQAMFRRRLYKAANSVCRNDAVQSFTDDDMYNCRLAARRSAFKQFRTARDYALRNGGSVTSLAAR